MAALKDVSAGIGTISYGNVTFGPLIRTEITGEPVYDEAERSIKCIRYTLTVHGFVYAADVAAMDTAMDALHDELLEVGNTLIIEDVGFDAGINTANGGATPDMIWGAKPRQLKWTTIGHIAAEVIWVCEFNVSRCATGSQLLFGPFAVFNWGSAYSINDEGLTTRVVRGYCEVPGIRGNATNVDAKWDRIVCPVPVGFRRLNNTREINYAKNRIDFGFTDTQLEGQALPAGVVKADLDYDFANTEPRNFLQWVATLSGSITVAPDKPPSLAGPVFFAILANKVAKLKQSAQSGSVLPLRVRVGHKLFSRTSHFAVTFGVATCLQEILTASGLWAPVPGADYATWAASMRNVWANRGTAGLRYNSADDRQEVDACVTYPTARIGTETSHATLVSGNFSQTLLCDVTKENSYLTYVNDVQGIAEHNATIHRYAQLYRPGSSPVGAREHVVQYQGAPDVMAIMVGHSYRIGFKPEAPQLLSIGGVQVELLAENTNAPDTPVARLFDCPVYFGQWTRLYRLPHYPSSAGLGFRARRPNSCPNA